MASGGQHTADVDLAHFFAGMAAPASYQSLAVSGGSPCALLGPPLSGKSSLMFQYALEVAVGGGRVVYISSCLASQQRRPLLPAQFDEDGDYVPAFERIELKYVTTHDELDRLLASMHVEEQAVGPPALLIIDAWTKLVPPGTPAHRIQRTKGLLRNLTADADAALVCPSAEAGAAAAPAMATGGGDRPQPDGEPPPVVLLAGDCDHDGATGASAFYETIPWWDMCPLVLRLVPDGGAASVASFLAGPF